MNAGAVARAMRAGVGRHRLQTVVVGLVVFAASAMVVLGVGLLVAADLPFERSFAAQRGAHAVVSYDTRLVDDAGLAATTGRPGVVATAGPFPLTTLDLSGPGGLRLPELTVVGRAGPVAAVDALELSAGRWVQGPGEIVLSRDFDGLVRVGDTVGAADGSALTVVGLANSVTETANAWVVPELMPALRGEGPAVAQMLYRFSSAADESSVAAAIASTTAGLPDGAVLGAGSYLTYRLAANQTAATATPFVLAFAVLGMVISILIVANVVSGAVVAGYRGIGVLKAVGFSPAQVVAVHSGRMLAPSVLGVAVGVVVGNLLAVPVLNETARAYDATVATVPWWASLVAIVGLLVTVGTAAVLPAVRAGRLPATQAIVLGRAPRPGRGRWARRILARTGLPRTVSLGFAMPLARPVRAVGALVAIALGATTLILAIGLASTLAAVADGLNRAVAAPVRVHLAGGGLRGLPPPDNATNVATLLRQTPGTTRVTEVRETEASVLGVAKPVVVTGYFGDASWVGYRIISGRWIGAADEAVLPTRLLRSSGTRVGDTLILRAGQRQVGVHIVGEVFDLDHEGLHVIADGSVVQALAPDARATWFEVMVGPNVAADAYVSALNGALPPGVIAWREGLQDDTITLFVGLIVTLTLLVVVVAGLGVFNTALLNTREQTREIGILKTIGMTPRQVRLMVVASLAGLGAFTSLLAVPLGLATHRRVLDAMASAAVTGLPPEFVAVFRPVELTLLAGVGLVIAVVGALVPAGWAARSRPATAMRAE